MCENIAQLSAERFQELFGFQRETFEVMLKILERAYRKNHLKGGRRSKLSVLEKLVVLLQCYREYRSMEHISFGFGVGKSTICDTIHWAEDTLIKSGKFRLPSKRERLKKENIVLLDATGCEIERPQKTARILFREKKRHSIKVQIISDFHNGNILCISVDKGKVHDFALLARSRVHFSDHIRVLADKGYQGISKLHSNSITPIKETKNHKLSRDEKTFNS